VETLVLVADIGMVDRLNRDRVAKRLRKTSLGNSSSLLDNASIRELPGLATTSSIDVESQGHNTCPGLLPGVHAVSISSCRVVTSSCFRCQITGRRLKLNPDQLGY